MTAPREPGPFGDHRAALEQYRRRASFYDLELTPFEPARRAAIERLGLRAGDTVLDVGCGTGLSLAPLHDAVGPGGHVIGIEQSAEMLARARSRVQHHGWRNVTLIEASAEDAAIGRDSDAALLHGNADAALFVFTHDILREPLAVANVARSLRPGASVVACGLQWADPWAVPLNLFVLGAALYSVTSLSGLTQPWSLLADHLDGLRVDTMMAGAVFVASGTLRPPPDPTHRPEPR